MSEQTNAVLAERVRVLERELVALKKATKEELREMELEMKTLEKEIANTKSLASEVNTSMKYVTTAVDEMKSLVHKFVDMMTEQNKGIDTKISSQNEKIDSFVNSDKRADSKKHLRVSVLQVVGMIIVAIIGLYAGGKM